MALDVLEQQRRAFFQADQIGDVGGFEIGAHFGGDALQFAHRLGLLQPEVEIAGVAAVAGSAAWLGFFGCSTVDGVAAGLDAHVHDATPCTLLAAILAKGVAGSRVCADCRMPHAAPHPETARSARLEDRRGRASSSRRGLRPLLRMRRSETERVITRAARRPGAWPTSATILARERVDLLLGHGLVARLDGDRDRDRFLAGLDALAFIDVEHADARDQLAVDRLRGAHDVGGLHRAIDHEGEVARHRLELPTAPAPAWRASPWPCLRGCAPGSPRTRPADLRRRAPPARADAIRRNGRARSAVRSGSCRSGRDGTRPARPAPPAAPARARRLRPAPRARRPSRRTRRPRLVLLDQCRPTPTGLASARRTPVAAVNWSSGLSPLKICPTSNSATSGKPRSALRCAAATRPGMRLGRMSDSSAAIGLASASSALAAAEQFGLRL